MIKKVPSKTVVRRKLVVRRETISQLTPHELEQAVGGWTVGGTTCTGTQQASKDACITSPD
jgi:hypothetical protein